MSRNFELLSQIEYELGAADRRTQAAADSRTRAATDKHTRAAADKYTRAATDKRTRVAADRPVVKTVVSKQASETCGEETLRMVQGIFLSTNGSAPRQVAFCGVDGESGSSSVCANAGRALAANSSRSVCLVDANLRSPRLSAIFGVDTTPVFGGKSLSVRDRCTLIGENLWLAGPSLLAGTSDVFPSVNELKERLAKLRSEFDYLLIDVAGANVRGDAVLLGQATDAVVLVVEANTTRREAARKAKQALDAVGARLLGTVLHDRSFPIPEGIYKRL